MITGIEPAVIVKAASAAATTSLFKSAVDRVERVVKGPAKRAAIMALAALKGYGPFLEETHDRVSTFKTFANPTHPVSVLDHFVTTEFEGTKKSSLSQDDLISRLARPSRVVVSAIAGYGKSMVMRYIALSLYENPMGRIPLFLELRHLNRISSPDILTYLHTSYRRITDIDVEVLRQGLAAGAFVLLLDGFDELNHDLRPIIEAQILEITKTYPRCSVVVSGRPDDRFLAWRSFTTLKIKPMSKLRVVELLHKLDYDAGTKKRFITKINKGLYDTHKSFLSTPLLAILMLLTFEQNANIPDKMHLFYAKAFETLFHKHDALKEQYDRARKSGLQVDEFERVFSVFCLKTYVLEKTEFTKAELAKSIREALAFEGHETNVDHYIFDIEEAVCLIMKEGNSYFFVHRSFQEYFTAVFLANCPEESRDEFIDQVTTRYWDNVLPMLFDMAQNQIEPTWVTRSTDRYLSMVGIDEPNKMLPVLARFSALEMYKASSGVHLMGFESGPFTKYIMTMRRFYREAFVKEVEISYGEIEKDALAQWNKLKGTQKQFKLDKETTAVTRKVPIMELPVETISRSKLSEFANHEFTTIQNIRQNISADQAAKNAFLSKLFGSSG